MQIFAKTFVNTNKNRIFALVFAYIWANGGCREIVLHLFFLYPFPKYPSPKYPFSPHFISSYFL